MSRLERRDGGASFDDMSATESAPLPGPVAVRQFSLVGAAAAQGKSFVSTSDRCAVGAHPSNDLVLDDRRVSRFHFEIVIDEGSAIIRDLDSRNGTYLDGVRVIQAHLRPGQIISIGDSALRFDLAEQLNMLADSDDVVFGALIGTSPAMRTAIAHLRKAAAVDATVLLEGESGTGKGAAASAIHEASSRRNGPLVVADCAAMMVSLIDSELFGHERGSFTGAVGTRAGAFEEANGGTIFLDEIGELPAQAQPKLLRVLEQRAVKRVGGSVEHHVDVRIIAATHRDLRKEVNSGRFRADLYHRLAVLRVVMPSLRERAADIPMLAARFARDMGADTETLARLLSADSMDRLVRLPWQGNARELRNYVERAIALGDFVESVSSPSMAPPPPPSEMVVLPPTESESDESLGALTRDQALASFEKRYLRALLARHQGNVARAADGAGIHRVHLHRLLRTHGLRGKG